MTRGVFRVVAKPVEDEWPESDVVIDLILDDNQNIVADRPYFGFQGLPEQAAPFILKRDGRLDFGRDYEEQFRYYDSNILERKIVIGSYFTIEMLNVDTNRRSEVTFRIKNIVRL